MSRWDEAGLSATKEERAYRVCESGHINIAGTSACALAKAYTRWDAEFAEVIEPGVRQLVFRLIHTYDCITYSSCEGHNSAPRACEPLSIRHVGIVPRDEAERRSLTKALEKAANAANRAAGSESVSIEVIQETLDSEGTAWPCIEIQFKLLAGGCQEYFLELERLDLAFQQQLQP